MKTIAKTILVGLSLTALTSLASAQDAARDKAMQACLIKAANDNPSTAAVQMDSAVAQARFSTYASCMKAAGFSP
jgi:hypothetical protein